MVAAASSIARRQTAHKEKQSVKNDNRNNNCRNFRRNYNRKSNLIFLHLFTARLLYDNLIIQYKFRMSTLLTLPIINVIISKTAYRREVRCKSVATAITVIEAIHKSEYPVRFNKIFGQESNVKLYSF